MEEMRPRKQAASVLLPDKFVVYRSVDLSKCVRRNCAD
jgi:hypothetical protein